MNIVPGVVEGREESLPVGGPKVGSLVLGPEDSIQILRVIGHLYVEDDVKVVLRLKVSHRSIPHLESIK